MPYSLIAVKYGETELPLRMAFADAADDDRKVPISLIVYLIQTPTRRILVDAGCDTMPGFPLHLHISPAKAVQMAGVAPEEITDVVLTHAHHDHVEAIGHFLNATVYIAAAEFESARKHLSGARAVETFEETLSLGEGITVSVSGGHSVGSAIVTVTHGEKEYAMVGDECYLRECLTKCRPTGISCNPLKSLAFVQTYSNPRYTVLLAHDSALLPGKIGCVRIF